MATKQDDKAAAQPVNHNIAPSDDAPAKATVENVKAALAGQGPMPEGVVINFGDAEQIRIEGD